jgi:hypothetical protein
VLLGSDLRPQSEDADPAPGSGTERPHRPLLVPLALAVPPRVPVSEPNLRRLDFPVRTSGHQMPPTPLRHGPHRHRRSDAPPTRRLVMSTASPAVPGLAEESPERRPRAAPLMSPRRGRTRPRALPAAAPLPREDQTAAQCDRPPTTIRTQHPRQRAPYGRERRVRSLAPDVSQTARTSLHASGPRRIDRQPHRHPAHNPDTTEATYPHRSGSPHAGQERTPAPNGTTALGYGMTRH